MQKFLGIIVLGLFLITPSQADDIRDFQIEGMSIGDSLLDYVSESKINKNKYYAYRLKDYYQTYFTLPTFKTYEYVQVSTKDDDNNFIIVSIEGGFYENFSKCKQKKKKIEKEIILLFPNLKVNYGKEKPMSGDPAGLSITTNLYSNTSSLEGDLIRIICVDRSKKIEKEKGWADTLKVVINTKEFNQFINKSFNP